jgi:hypothetical protein
MSDLNQSAIRKHALACAQAHRNGRFTRVGQDFMDEVNAEVEAIVRDLAHTRFPTQIHAPLESPEQFVTGPLLEKVREALNSAIARLIQNKVGKQPSVGCTLGRTR